MMTALLITSTVACAALLAAPRSALQCDTVSRITTTTRAAMKLRTHAAGFGFLWPVSTARAGGSDGAPPPRSGYGPNTFAQMTRRGDALLHVAAITRRSGGSLRPRSNHSVGPSPQAVGILLAMPGGRSFVQTARQPC